MASSEGPPIDVRIAIDPFPGAAALDDLCRAAWGAPPAIDMAAVLARSLAHVGAYDAERLVGFANVATDGGIHASLFDVCVHPGWHRRGIGSALVRAAVTVARERGAQCLHVDFEPHLDGFYRACGFRPTAAGLIRLA